MGDGSQALGQLMTSSFLKPNSQLSAVSSLFGGQSPKGLGSQGKAWLMHRKGLVPGGLAPFSQGSPSCPLPLEPVSRAEQPE